MDEFNVSEILSVLASVATIVLAVCAVWALWLASAQVQEARRANRAQLTMRGGFLLELFRQWESPNLVQARKAFYDLVRNCGLDLGRDLYDETPFPQPVVDRFTGVLNHETRADPIKIENIQRIMRFLDLVALLVERGFVDKDDCAPVFRRSLLDVDQLTRPYFTGKLSSGETMEGPPETRNVSFPHAWALADKFPR